MSGEEDFSESGSASSVSDFSDEVENDAELQSDGEDQEGSIPTKPRKHRVMLLGSRGINARHRHLLDDLHALLPHSRKESKFDPQRTLFELNELAELNGASHCLYFEHRRPQELFWWIAATPSGPSARFHVQSIETLQETGLTGNHMRGTRPILSFDSAFMELEQGPVWRSLLESIFGPPSQGEKRVRPHHDHLLHFSWADDRIWVRNYAIHRSSEQEEQLEEVGPRFVLHPVVVLAGAFSGQQLWKNPNFRPAAEIRQQAEAQQSASYRQRHHQQTQLMPLRRAARQLPRPAVESIFDQ